MPRRWYRPNREQIGPRRTCADFLRAIRRCRRRPRDAGGRTARGSGSTGLTTTPTARPVAVRAVPGAGRAGRSGRRHGGAVRRSDRGLAGLGGRLAAARASSQATTWPRRHRTPSSPSCCRSSNARGVRDAFSTGAWHRRGGRSADVRAEGATRPARATSRRVNDRSGGGRRCGALRHAFVRMPGTVTSAGIHASGLQAQSLEFGAVQARRRGVRMAIAREAEPVGSLSEVREAGLDREDLLGIYRNMLITRGIEERGHILYKQGKIPGSFYTGRGNEAARSASRRRWARTTSARRSTATWASTSPAASSRGGSSPSTWAARTGRRRARTATSTWPTRTSA